MTAITIRMPEDVVDELKRVAPLLGFSGYQPLVRFYVGQGLRTDLARLDSEALVESLKRHGIAEETIRDAIADSTSIRGANVSEGKSTSRRRGAAKR